jgi:hypothetical protein
MESGMLVGSRMKGRAINDMFSVSELSKDAVIMLTVFWGDGKIQEVDANLSVEPRSIEVGQESYTRIKSDMVARKLTH